MDPNKAGPQLRKVARSNLVLAYNLGANDIELDTRLSDMVQALVSAARTDAVFGNLIDEEDID